VSTHQWTVLKDGQTFIFRCQPGGEGRLLAEIMSLTERGQIGLDDSEVLMLIRTIAEAVSPEESGLAALVSMSGEEQT
jgi:hypothetical protein